MKLLEFVYVIHYAARARLTGGCNYTVTVWQNKGPGKLLPVGVMKACTASHAGEECTAWQVVTREQPRILRRFQTAGKEGLFTCKHYFSWRDGEAANVKMTRLYVVS